MAGMSPLTNTAVDSARLIAKLPDGRIEPLVWLYHFDPKYRHSFTFRSRSICLRAPLSNRQRRCDLRSRRPAKSSRPAS